MAARDKMDENSSGDSGLAGWKVTERLQTLTVACPPKEDEGGGSSLPEGLSGEERHPPPPPPPGSTRGPREAATGEEKPPPLGLPGFSSLVGQWPRLNPGEGPGAEGAAAEEAPLGGGGGGGGPAKAPLAGKGDEERPPPSPAPHSDSSSLLALDGEQASRTSQARESPKGHPEAAGPTTPGGNGEEESAMETNTAASPSSSSASESESDTDTDSSSSSSSCLPLLSEDDEPQCKNEKNSCSTKKKGESTAEKLQNVEELKIILPESVELMAFGNVSSIIEHQVIIESEKGLPPVNEDTVLFKDDRHAVGKVFEVFGPVSHPFYVVQFNSPENIVSRGIKVRDAVYFAPLVESFTQYIFPEKLKQERGSDASWKNDEEPPPEALEFSDDEKEKAAKQQKKSQNMRRKKFKQDYNENGPNCQPRQQHPVGYREIPNTRFSRGRFPQPSVPPRFFRPPTRTPQYYSDYTEPKMPSGFYQQQRQDNLRRHQYPFPPPSFEAVNNETNFPSPPPPVTWGWPHPYTPNIYDPLLSLLSLPPPPPPPPPFPPPPLSAAISSKSMTPP